MERTNHGAFSVPKKVYLADEVQLAQLHKGSFDLALSSPAWMGSDMRKGGSDLLRDSRVRTGRNPDAPGTASLLSQSPYENEPGQLAQMPEGDLTLALGSPPFQGSLSRDNVTAGRIALAREKGISVHLVSPVDMEKIGKRTQNYDAADGQLAALPEGSHAEACARPVCCVSSPPYAQSNQNYQEGFSWIETDRDYSKENFCGRAKYGREEGQLAQMPTGSHTEALEAGAGRANLCLSSPPYEATVNAGREGIDWSKTNAGGRAIMNTEFRYGHTEGNVGNETGSTFWAASRTILEEVYKMLAPGAHAIWVLKMFVRSGRLVDFPGQWEALCQSVGFRTVCKHRAWMNKNADIMQATLDGDEVSMAKWYKSFFRILCESKGSPRIDWELILCMEKPIN